MDAPIIVLMSEENEYRFLPQDVWQNCEAVTPKLTQISRISEKSLLCNGSMNTWLDAWASDGFSYFDRHAPATMRYAALHSILQNRMQVVASASALRNTWIPPGDEYGKTRLSKIETAKQLDFSKSVSDKTILVSLAHGYSNNLRQKSYLHFGHKKYYGRNQNIVVRSLSFLL